MSDYKGVIVIYPLCGWWMADMSGSTEAGDIMDMLDTDQLPTPFAVQDVDVEAVAKVLEATNPQHYIHVQSQRPPSPHGGRTP